MSRHRIEFARSEQFEMDAAYEFELMRNACMIDVRDVVVEWDRAGRASVAFSSSRDDASKLAREFADVAFVVRREVE